MGTRWFRVPRSAEGVLIGSWPHSKRGSKSIHQACTSRANADQSHLTIIGGIADRQPADLRSPRRSDAPIGQQSDTQTLGYQYDNGLLRIHFKQIPGSQGAALEEPGDGLTGPRIPVYANKRSVTQDLLDVVAHKVTRTNEN